MKRALGTPPPGLPISLRPLTLTFLTFCRLCFSRICCKTLHKGMSSKDCNSCRGLEQEGEKGSVRGGPAPPNRPRPPPKSPFNFCPEALGASETAQPPEQCWRVNRWSSDGAQSWLPAAGPPRLRKVPLAGTPSLSPRPALSCPKEAPKGLGLECPPSCPRALGEVYYQLSAPGAERALNLAKVP